MDNSELVGARGTHRRSAAAMGGWAVGRGRRREGLCVHAALGGGERALRWPRWEAGRWGEGTTVA